MGFKVERIVTFYPQDPESMLFHVPNVEWTTLQARSINLPHKVVHVPRGLELKVLSQTLLNLKEEHGIEGLVAGVIASNYQKKALEETCNKAGLQLVTPLWGQNPFEVLHRMIHENFHSIIVGVYAEGLTQQWLGKEIDYDFLDYMKRIFHIWKVNPCGEGGEYETFVIDAPFFTKRIRVVEGKITWHRNWGELIILRAELVEKG